ncbi:MAG: SDR family oxidoreductase [Bacteroidetes bacterium]|nr:SDR family oxidoreductase [Bacteroidota bacterium]
MIDLEKIKRQLIKGKSIEDITGEFNWKDFEKTVGEIFRNNGFRVKNNFNFKTNRRFEIDIIARGDGHVLCVDCKQWSRGRNKISALKKAAEDQENRTKEFKKFLRKNLIAKQMIKINSKQKYSSLIVTLHEEKIIKEIPLRKIAVPEDIAGAVIFLASDLASHITGCVINVNGGSVL